jgi:hypothetical protein
VLLGTGSARIVTAFMCEKTGLDAKTIAAVVDTLLLTATS